ncbi:MAG TPA: zf-HC2 domain-containing protein [Ktedonobacteraceae bacterium]
MAQDKRHLTTEQLSALLDKEASAAEQAQWEAHLSTCPQCQRALTALRQTVAMLHALPQPTLPRSFVLSMEAAEPSAKPVVVAPTPIRPTRRRLNPYVRGVLRTVSALAAMIGVVFFLSGVLPALVRGGGATTASSTSSSGSSVSVPINGSTQASAGTKVPTAVRSSAISPLATATATSVVQPQPPNTTNQPSDSARQSSPSPEPTFLIFNLSTAAGRVGLGMLLVLLGGMGWILFKRSRRA